MLPVVGLIPPILFDVFNNESRGVGENADKEPVELQEDGDSDEPSYADQVAYCVGLLKTMKTGAPPSAQEGVDWCLETLIKEFDVTTNGEVGPPWEAGEDVEGGGRQGKQRR